MRSADLGRAMQPRGEKTRLARATVSRLHQLGEVTAPPELLAKVMARVRPVPDRYFSLESPLGRVWVAYSARGVSAVTKSETAEEFEAFVLRTTGRPAEQTEEPPAQLVDALQRRLRGDTSARVDFDLRGLSEFEQAVLVKALEIPWGEVRPYGWIAREINRPRAVRAVGTALAHNPVPLFIPCHRVVRSDGFIGNYSLGGRGAKLTMLRAEGVDPAKLEKLAASGVRYVGSDSTHIFCFPTCRHARRITQPHLVSFRSAAAARSSGYRPCKVCRPDEVAA